MDRAYPALRQMFTDIRNLWFEKIGRELRSFSIELSDFLYGLENHPTGQWHERFHVFAAGQRFQGRYMTPESEEALLAYINEWAAMQVAADHAVEEPEAELDQSWPELSDAERTRVRGRLGLPGFYAKPFELGDDQWEDKLEELARVARDKMLATCRELQTLGSLARNADQLPDDGLDALKPNIARVQEAHDEYVHALIDIERTWLAYIKAHWYVGWQMEQLVLKIAGDLPPRLFDLPSSQLEALARARAEVGHALDQVVKRVDTTYKVAYWTDVSITILESVTGIVGAVKAAAKEAVKQGIKFSLLKAIKAAIKQAAIQGAVFVATAYGLPPVLQASGLNPDFVFAGVVVMQGLTAFQALRSVKVGKATGDSGIRVSGNSNRIQERMEASAQPRTSTPNGTTLPKLPKGYHYRRVGGKIQVARNPGRAVDLPALHLENGQLRLGPSLSVVRNTATRNAFLRLQASKPNVPKTIRPWLERGEVPPGYTVHHKKALFDGGTDTIDNMVLQAIDLHIITHRFYRPGGQVPSITPAPGTFQQQ